jgi:hypothetical protein
MTTEQEINNLKLVFEMARDRHPEVKDCIIAGDMNADLHYVKDPDALQLYKDPKVSLFSRRTVRRMRFLEQIPDRFRRRYDSQRHRRCI